MMPETVVNANALFQGLKSQESFHRKIAIRPGDEEDRRLRRARRLLRSAIRAAFSEFGELVRDDEIRLLLFENRTQDFRNALRREPISEVRFLTQGSFAYDLLIRPAQESQELDLDDGVYVPMPFIGGRPVVSSKGLFDIVKKAIDPVVREQGWTYERKDTCLRVKIGGSAHIDLPLYAVESSEFANVKKHLEERTGHSMNDWRGLKLLNSSGFGQSVHAKGIKLAHRDTKIDWLDSDPKEFADWFAEYSRLFGPVLRRLIRYLKAWRDFRWEDGELKSMAIMIAAIGILERFEGRPHDERDDVLILDIARKLPGVLRVGDIRWHPDRPALDEKWHLNQRDEIVQAAVGFQVNLERALVNTGVPKLTIEYLREAFGERFPDAPDSIEIGKASKIAAIADATPSTVPQPKVGSSVSG